jgi:hypothetical protein
VVNPKKTRISMWIRADVVPHGEDSTCWTCQRRRLREWKQNSTVLYFEQEVAVELEWLAEINSRSCEHDVVARINGSLQCLRVLSRIVTYVGTS